MSTQPHRQGILWLLCGLLLAQLISVSTLAQPALVSSSPANAAQNVPLDSDISFTFNTAMKPQQSINWTGLDPSKLSYGWSADKKTLTCSYDGDLPSGAEVTWQLMPSFPPILVGFEDESGNAWPFTTFYVGLFFVTSGGGGSTNCPGSGPSTNAGSITSFSMFKSASYVQNSAGPSTPDTSTEPFSFFATVNLATNRTATAVTLTVPGGSPQEMTSIFGSPYFLGESTNDLAALEATYPPGNYAFNVSGTPNQQVNANLPADTLPNAPHLSNFTAAQTINAGANFTLTWDPFIGGPPEEVISVEIRDSLDRVVFELTNAAGCPRLLPGTATSVVVPGGTLSSNQNYTLQLMFLHPVSTTTNATPPTVTMVSGQSFTEIAISTGTGGGVPSMVLTNVVWLPAGQLQFEFPTAPGTDYTVEYTSAFGSPTSWTTLINTNATGSTVQITDTPPSGAGARYYRTRHN